MPGFLPKKLGERKKVYKKFSNLDSSIIIFLPARDLVSTPIGNLADISVRALSVLKNSDIILCEDKRVSKKLLDYYDIKAQLFS